MYYMNFVAISHVRYMRERIIFVVVSKTNHIFIICILLIQLTLLSKSIIFTILKTYIDDLLRMNSAYTVFDDMLAQIYKIILMAAL